MAANTQTENVRGLTPRRRGGLGVYGRLLRTDGIPAWVMVVLGQRIPVAASPLALVYLGEHATGSYGIGALLAGVFALAEAVFAGVLGRRFDRRPPRAEMKLVLGVQALAFLALGGLPALAPSLASVWVLVALTGVAGGVAAGAHGGLRALLVRTVPESVQQAALSFEATVTSLMWAVGPAAVGGLAVLAGSTLPVLVIGVVAGAGVLAAGRLHEPAPVAADPGQTTSPWGRGWPAMLQEAAVMLAFGTVTTALPALLVSLRASADLAGPVLAGLALAGMVGGTVYGMRTWPGSYRTQTVVLLLALAAVLVVVSATPLVAVVAALVVAAGLLQAPALTARAAGLQELLPPSQWAAGFSGLYAAGGLGFGVAGFLVAPLLETTGPRLALLGGGLLAAVIAVAAGLAEARIARQTPSSEDETTVEGEAA